MDPRIKNLISKKDKNWRFLGNVYDTFTALPLIASYDKSLLLGEPLGKISSLLISIEKQPGGPYYSEFQDVSESKKNTDRKTNEAIYRFLKIYDISLPGLNKFLHKKKEPGPEGSKKSPETDRSTFDDTELEMMSAIKELLQKKLARFDIEFQKSAEAVIEKTIRGNPDKQMSLMPYFMAQALGKSARRIPKELTTGACLSNMFFWTAFIIYDDFWDEDEAAEPKLLPIANFFARSYIEFFSSQFKRRKGFREFFREIMDELDGANFWENSRCRAKVENGIFYIPKILPKYQDYANKYRPASGHALGPVLFLLLSKPKTDSEEVKLLVEYFQNYLIAMQMNDDMHDWEEDLRRGHISTAVDMLIRDLGKDKKVINLENEMGRLRRTFWFTTLPKIAKRALFYVKKSRIALGNIKSLENPNPLIQFINLNQKIAEKAMSEHLESVQFLKAYGKFDISGRK